MTAIQFIERDGKREFAVIPIELFDRVADILEDLADQAALDAFRARDDGFRIPGTVADAILDGIHPVQAWREYRGLTLDILAERTGLDRSLLRQIETGTSDVAPETLGPIARILGITADDLRN